MSSDHLLKEPRPLLADASVYADLGFFSLCLGGIGCSDLKDAISEGVDFALSIP